ncbi:MAG: potassium channel protein [Desulfosalsimonadaceae bacterium]
MLEISKHLRISLTLVVATTLIGTFGYMSLEGWGLLDAAYMTIITMTTVGYGEVHAMSHTGRIFTIFLVTMGAVSFLYVTSALVQFLVETQIRTIFGRRVLDKRIKHMKKHYIICGYGRIGQVLCNNFRAHGIEPVVIEKEQDRIEHMEAQNLLYISGDATEEEALLRAGIDRAKALIAALATDTDSVFLVLTARQLNPEIFILARASSVKARAKLYAAGANRVESPYEIGAISMAQRILRPSVSNFLDLVFAYNRKDIQMDEIPVAETSPLAGLMLRDSGIRQKYNLIIIAVKTPDGNMLFNPSHETLIRAGDTVIAMGKTDNLAELEKELQPEREKKPAR